MVWEGGFILISTFRSKAEWEKEFLVWVGPSWGPEPSAPHAAGTHPP